MCEDAKLAQIGSSVCAAVSGCAAWKDIASVFFSLSTPCIYATSLSYLSLISPGQHMAGFATLDTCL